MTHLCYTLEEAAEKLKLSETVLVRLSQYFKVPKAAYEEVGYLSFKGDLTFGEQDLTFFRQAKEHLVRGESLDVVKHRLEQESQESQESGSQPPKWVETPPPPQQSTGPDEELPNTEEIREVQDRKPYEKAAEQSFERYKSMHRTGLSKVFSNMLKEVGTSASKKRSDASLMPGFRPLRNKQEEKPNATASKSGKATRPAAGGRHSDALLPFNRHSALEETGSIVNQTLSTGSWEQLIQQAAHQPRVVNTQLKIAAQLLRQRAMGHTGQADSSSHS